MRTRLGQDLLQGIGIVPNQVFHLDPAETSDVAQWPAADCPHMLLELRRRGAAERPVAGIVHPGSDLVHHEAFGAVLGDQKQLDRDHAHVIQGLGMSATEFKGVGEAVLRKEDSEFLTGEGRYVDDIKLPGMLHIAIVRSPYAHAKITSIDGSGALAIDGVTAVITAADLTFAAGVPCASNPTGNVRQPARPQLATDRVRHLGEPVAVVVAADRYAARDGVDAVEVDYEPLEAVIGVENALAPGAVRVHEEYPDNTCVVIENKTDGVDEAFAKADVVVKQVFRNQRLIPTPIEPRGVVAHWIPSSDDLTVYTSTQIPHFVRTFLAICCNVSEAKVRVVAPDVGGGFGSKLNCYAEEFIAAAVSRKVGAPVKWIEERSESMTATIHGRAQDAHMEIAATREGKVLGLRAHYVQDCGSYLQLLTPTIAHLTLFMAGGAYDIQPVDLTVTEVFTNTTPTDAYRGAGRPEATHAIERIMDMLAAEVGISRGRGAPPELHHRVPLRHTDRPDL